MSRGSPFSLVQGESRKQGPMDRNVKETIIKAILLACACFSVIIIFSIIGYTLWGGAPVIEDIIFHGSGAILNPIYGGNTNELADAMYTTMIVAAGGTALAIAVGLPIAIYMAEFSDMRLRNLTKTSLEVLDGFPSIVIGIAGAYTLLWAINNKYSLDVLLSKMGAPDISGGGCIFFAWIILFIMSFPIVATISEDSLRAVSQDLREAALGIGATRWQTTTKVLLPVAWPRVLASILLSFAAAMGETVAIQFVLGNNFAYIHSPFNLLNPLIPSATLSMVLNSRYKSALDSTGTTPTTAYAEAFILFIMIGLVNILVRGISSRQKMASKED